MYSYEDSNRSNRSVFVIGSYRGIRMTRARERC